MDETARVTWYEELLAKQLVQPRLPRFGILVQQCGVTKTACRDIIQRRMKAKEPFLLLKDAGGLVRTFTKTKLVAKSSLATAGHLPPSLNIFRQCQ
jgi:hypothetical protein